uniref:CHAT domain-containing protein n=1 Tax=Tolypothrix bouteillei VB521301 TaxID=1479485 RepID=A0A0C1QMZ2_9CYAN
MSNNVSIKTILILSANPKGTTRLEGSEEVREIGEALRRAKKREQFKLEMELAVRIDDFYRAILDYQPQIVHFSGHGSGGCRAAAGTPGTAAPGRRPFPCRPCP